MSNLVIIPTYNEIQNISRMIQTVMSLPCGMSLLVIDDGSPDGTADVVRNFAEKFPDRIFLMERGRKLGLGTAYIAGFRWALERGFTRICEMDCDFSHNPEDLTRLIEAADQGADLVIGSRYVKGVSVVNWPMGRLLMSYYASRYVHIATGLPLRDSTAGFVCYTSELLRRIDLDAVRMKGYGFQIEMKYTAWKLGFTLREIPIVFTERQEGVSKISGGIFREALFGVLGLRFRKIAPRV